MFLSRYKKNNVYPCKGVNIIQACLRDGFLSQGEQYVYLFSVNSVSEGIRCAGKQTERSGKSTSVSSSHTTKSVIC